MKTTKRKTKIAFIVDHRLVFEPLGIMQLSAIVKKEGFEVKMFEKNRRLSSRIKEYRPHIFCYSVITSSQESYFKLNTFLKKSFPEVYSIFGGPFPTYNQDFFEAHSDIDALCIGEGDYALLDFLKKYEAGDDFYHADNFYTRHEGKIIKNNIKNLVENLDELPSVDRDVAYEENDFLKENPVKRFYVSRGCTFSCNYCFHHSFKALYHNKGTMFRERSAEHVVSEIAEVREQYHLECIKFVDDMLSSHFLKNFLPLYKQRISLPFSCHMNPKMIVNNPELVTLMKEAGCFLVSLGIESGNDYIRNSILNRDMDRNDIIEACKILKRNKIAIMTLNMLGNPSETFQMSLETLDFNMNLGVDFAGCSLLQPYKGTKLYEHAVVNGYLVDASIQGDLYYNDSPILFKPAREKKLVVNLQKFFSFICRNKLFYSIITKGVIRVPTNVLFSVFNRAYEFFVLWKIYPNRFSIRLLLRFVRNYFSFFQKA